MFAGLDLERDLLDWVGRLLDHAWQSMQSCWIYHMDRPCTQSLWRHSTMAMTGGGPTCGPKILGGICLFNAKVLTRVCHNYLYLHLFAFECFCIIWCCYVMMVNLNFGCIPKKKKKGEKNNSSILVSDFMVNKCCGKVDE